MSSNQNNPQSKRVRSIARALNGHIFRRKLGQYFCTDLLMIVLAVAAWIPGIESGAGLLPYTGSVTRSVEFDYDLWYELKADYPGAPVGKLAYLIDRADTSDALLNYMVYRDGTLLMDVPVGAEAAVLVGGITGLFIVQLLFCLIRLPFERDDIRRRLRPLTRIAQRADELSRDAFDDSKYHLLEEKISSLGTEETLDVTQGDRDLENIETAINNLLLRMRESYRQQARFVNDASHELRTPIAVIEGYANMLARWGREDAKVLDESITAIQHESGHMKYLVEQLLFLARGDTGRTVLKPEKVSAGELIREIYEESLMIDEKHVYKLETEDENDPYTIECDPALIKQAVRILVDNSVKYTDEHGEISLAVGRENGQLYLQVQDTGIGMDESDLEHMFERFYRADKARTFNEGTGLGLSIAKWIVDKHGGHFEAVSRCGLGTRIRIVLQPCTAE